MAHVSCRGRSWIHKWVEKNCLAVWTLETCFGVLNSWSLLREIILIICCSSFLYIYIFFFKKKNVPSHSNKKEDIIWTVMQRNCGFGRLWEFSYDNCNFLSQMRNKATTWVWEKCGKTEEKGDYGKQPFRKTGK